MRKLSCESFLGELSALSISAHPAGGEAVGAAAVEAHCQYRTAMPLERVLQLARQRLPRRLRRQEIFVSLTFKHNQDCTGPIVSVMPLERALQLARQELPRRLHHVTREGQCKTRKLSQWGSCHSSITQLPWTHLLLARELRAESCWHAGTSGCVCANAGRSAAPPAGGRGWNRHSEAVGPATHSAVRQEALPPLRDGALLSCLGCASCG